MTAFIIIHPAAQPAMEPKGSLFVMEIITVTLLRSSYFALVTRSMVWLIGFVSISGRSSELD